MNALPSTPRANSLRARWRIASIACVALLVLCVIGWQRALAADAIALNALLFSLPALAPLRGLWLGRRYTYRWASLCVLPYFIVGVTESFANPAARGWTLALLGLALAWFFSLIGFLRATTAVRDSHDG